MDNELGFDYKDILSILSFFKHQETKTDLARDITSRCEEIIYLKLTSMNPETIASGNYLPTTTDDD